MEEKVTAVYLLVWKHELTAEDEGSYERPLAAQKEKCLKFIREKGIRRFGNRFLHEQERFIQGRGAGPGGSPGRK